MADTLTEKSTVPRRPSARLNVVGIVLSVGGVGMLVAAAVDAIDGGPDVAALTVTGLVTLAVGGLCWWLTEIPPRLRIVDIFVIVTSSWLALSLVGAVPYLVTDTFDSFEDALFESISGFTTTGATLLRPIEEASAGVLFWRALTQWFGGIGVIVLVVAVLPVLGSGGMELLAAEAPGPAGERLTPRVRDTARRLLGVYLAMTVGGIIAYVVVGMDLYDAVAHTFTTVSTGGFSTHSRSIAHFESAAVEWAAIIGMLLAGGNFVLYVRALRNSARPLLRSAEFQLYVAIIAGATVFAMLAQGDVDGWDHDAWRGAAFSVTSVVTTTGYVTVDFGSWAQSAQVLLLLLMPVGAMAGSTAGGVKLVRVLAVGSYASRETRRQLHPRMVRPVRVGRDVIDERTAQRVLGFLVLALAIFGVVALVVAATGADTLTSFSAAATSYGNVGPGLGAIGPTSDFNAIEPLGRWASMSAMLLGRLEIYPVLLAFAAIPLPRIVRAIANPPR